MANRTREHLDSLGYSPTMTGIGALLQGINSGITLNQANKLAQAQLANQTQETAWKNPYRPVSDLDIAKEKSDPIKQAMAQLLLSANKIQAPQGSGQPPAPTTSQASTPAPIWQNWTGDDFMGFKEELKKRGLA